MRPRIIVTSLLLALLLAAPGAAAQTDDALPCLHPVDVRCVVQEAAYEAAVAIDYGHDVLDYAQDVVDWVECQLTSLIWCGTVPQPPLPPYVPTTDAAQADADLPADGKCNLHVGCDVGPCAHAQVGPGVDVDPGAGGCYTDFTFETADQLLGTGAALVQYLRDLVDWVECVQDGGGIECDSPPLPPSDGVELQAAAQADRAELPCLFPVDAACLVHLLADLLDALLAQADATVQWLRDVTDWLECSLTSSHFCGTMPPAPLPPVIDVEAGAQASDAARIEVGPCAWVDPGTSGGWDLGDPACYTSWASGSVQEWEDWEDAMTDWVDDWREYVECGMHLECTPPDPMPSPPAGGIVDVTS